MKCLSLRKHAVPVTTDMLRSLFQSFSALVEFKFDFFYIKIYVLHKNICSLSIGHKELMHISELGRAVEHSTSDHWVPGSKPGVFMSGELSSFVSLPGGRSVTHKTLAVNKRR